MNRLLITILLVLAFAMSFVKLAHAQDGAPASPNKGNSHMGLNPKAPARPNSATATSAAPAVPAAATTGSVTTDANAAVTAPSVDDICKGDADCGQKTIDLGNDKESKLKATKVDGKYTATQVCSKCDGVSDYQPVEITIDPTKNRDELKKDLGDMMSKAADQIKGLAQLQAKKEFAIDSCQATDDSSIKMVDGKPKLTLVKFKTPKIAKKSDDDDDFDTDLDNVELTPQRACEEQNAQDFADSEDPIKQRALKKIVASFEDRLGVLNQKAALGTLTKAESAEYQKLAQFQTETIMTNPSLSQVASDYLTVKIQNEQNALRLAVQNADQNKKGNPAAAAQALANLKDAAAIYGADIKLASAISNAAAQSNSDYQTKAAYLNSLANDPQDLSSSISKISAAIPASVKSSIAGGSGTFSSVLAQDAGTTDSSTDSNFDKNLKTAQGIAERTTDASLLMEALSPNYLTTEPKLNWNSNMSNMPAHFRVGSLGTGQMSSQYNQVSPTFTGSNMVANSVATQPAPFSNTGNSFQQNFPQSGISQPVNSGFSGSNFSSTPSVASTSGFNGFKRN